MGAGPSCVVIMCAGWALIHEVTALLLLRFTFDGLVLDVLLGHDQHGRVHALPRCPAVARLARVRGPQDALPGFSLAVEAAV